MGRNPNYSSALLKANKIVSMDVIRLAPQPRLSRPSPAFHLHLPIPPIPPNPFILAPYKANSHPPPPHALRPIQCAAPGVPHPECAPTPAPANTLPLPGTPENLHPHSPVHPPNLFYSTELAQKSSFWWGSSDVIAYSNMGWGVIEKGL